MPTLAASCVHVILRLAATVINPSQNLQAAIAHVSEKIEHAPRLRVLELAQLFETMTQDAEDVDIGARAYGLFHPGQLNAQLYAIMSSATLGEGLRTFEKFSSLLAESAPISIGYSEDAFYIKFHRFEELDVSRQYIDCCMSTMMGLVHWLLPVEKPMPIAATFSYPAPVAVDKLMPVFGPNLLFSARFNQIVFASSEWKRPLVTANAVLKAHHLHHVNEELLRRRSGRAADAVRSYVMETLAVGATVSVGAVARQLNISCRTLQNRLDDERTTYRALLDQSRRELADQLLTFTEETITSIAERLSFQDSSSFHKACNRWFGCAPGVHRSRAAEMEAR